MRKQFQRLMLNPKHAKLRYFAPLAAILLLLITVLAALLLNTAGLHEILQENTENYADDVSAQLASNISSRMRMRELYICNLADTVARIPDDLLTAEMLGRKAKYLGMKEIFVINPDGTTIPARTGDNSLHQYLAENPELYKDSHIFFTNNEVFYSAPILYPDGTIRLLIGVRTNATLQKMLQEVNFKNQGMCCIIDSEGMVVVSPVDNEPFQQLVEIFKHSTNLEDAREAEQVLQDIRAHRSGLAHFQDVDGKSIMLGYDFLEINDWMLLTLVPGDLFSSGSQFYVMRYMVILGIMSIAMLLLFVSLARYYRRSIRHIQRMAMTDPLTGGNNYLAFRVKGESLLREDPLSAYTIVYVNIKNFKWFNERFGVKTGDQLLKQVYDCLQHHLQADELMGRNSGDHFYLLLAGDGEEAIEQRLNSILHVLEGQIAAAFTTDYIRLELGAYIIRERDNDIDLMVLADRAKIASNHQDEGHVCRFYDAQLQQEVEYSHALNDFFSRAIEDREFQLYIQPKVRPGQSTAHSGEVLVRWQHPEYGLISPGDFIPLFERNGKICELDFYVFEETCRLMKGWLAEGRRCSLSVNLSRAHLISNDLSFLDRFREIKEQYGIPDGLIELELTESMMLERRDLRLVITMIDRIREMGFLCSIDDFGFGYSSLALLKDLNVTTVKLDRQFFLDESEKSWLVVQQLIQLAHSLDMTVVAEGIEDQRQVEHLRACGCDLIQGYVYAKPMPVPSFTRWTEQQ